MKLSESYIGSYLLIVIGLLSTLLAVVENEGSGASAGLAIVLITLAYMSAKYRRVNVAMLTTFRVGYEFLTVILSLFIILGQAINIDNFLQIESMLVLIWIAVFVSYLMINIRNRENDIITHKSKDADNKSIEDSVVSTNSNLGLVSNKNFFLKLKDGDYGLAKTYWLYGVVVNVIFKVLGAYAGSYSQKLFATVLIVNIIYSLLWLVGLHNAATKYEGSKIWAVLTYVMILVWLFNTLMLFIGVKSTLGYMD